MKKLNCVVVVWAMLFVISFCIGVSGAKAETEILPKGSLVSAEVSGDQATVTIRGVTPTMVELYSFKGIKSLGAVNTFTIDLSKGRRFNFLFGDNTYALLTPDMVKYPPSFVGKNIGIDDSNPNGCCFIILQ